MAATRPLTAIAITLPGSTPSSVAAAKAGTLRPVPNLTFS